MEMRALQHERRPADGDFIGCRFGSNHFTTSLGGTRVTADTVRNDVANLFPQTLPTLSDQWPWKPFMTGLPGATRHAKVAPPGNT